MILNFVKMSCFCIYHALSAVSSNVSYLQSYQAGETLWAFSCALSGAATLQALWGCNLIPALIKQGGAGWSSTALPSPAGECADTTTARSSQLSASGWMIWRISLKQKYLLNFKIQQVPSMHGEETVVIRAWWSWSLSWSVNKAHHQLLVVVSSDQVYQNETK